MQQPIEENEKAPYKMIQTIGLSVGAAVAYIIVVLGLMFYCKKRRNAKRLQKSTEREEPEMECLNGGCRSRIRTWGGTLRAPSERRHLQPESGIAE